jgi:Glycosyl transferase family 2
MWRRWLRPPSTTATYITPPRDGSVASGLGRSLSLKGPQGHGRPADHRIVFRPTLVVVAYRETAHSDLEALLSCLVSIRETAPEAQVLVIEDPTPESSSLAEAAAAELGCAHVVQDEPDGLAAAANAGLEVARASGFDAVLVGCDVVVTRAGWLAAMQSRLDTQGRPAAVVGGRLHLADGLIDHAGYFYSVLQRRWLSRYYGVPAEVPETLAPTLCPVSSRLQLIRHETLEAVGLLDDALTAPYVELDYCLRVFTRGLECVHEPAAAGRSPRRHVPLKRDETEEQGRQRRLVELRYGGPIHNRFIPDIV